MDIRAYGTDDGKEVIFTLKATLRKSLRNLKKDVDKVNSCQEVQEAKERLDDRRYTLFRFDSLDERI